MMPDYLFEISSEAGRKIGGIYTVIQSKSALVLEKFHNNYFLVGMYDEASAKNELAADEVPEDFRPVFEELEGVGIKVYYGRWRNGSNARLILVDANAYRNMEKYGFKRIDLVKKELWDEYKVDSLMMGEDYTSNVSWASAAGLVVEKLLRLERFRDKKIVAHCHEWISGAALLHIKKYCPGVGLVFTTHATSFGRTLTGYGRDIMDEAEEGLKKGWTADLTDAYNYHIEGQHLIEKACAANSVFTTVSEITGKEAEYVLAKKPDLILPNALDFKKFGSIDEILRKHTVSRNKVYTFLRSYFLPYYKAKVYHCPIIYLSGRYEIKSKGIDLMICAMGKLNDELKKRKYSSNIYFIIFVPTGNKGPKPSVVNNYATFQKIEDNIDEVLTVNKENIINNWISEKNSDKIVELSKLKESDSLFKALETEGENPPIPAFNLSYDNDAIINMLKEQGLDNTADDVVKVIFYPTYLGENDGVLGLNYYEAISGMDIGVFPSRYEPWGYTPIEAGANMNVAITSDRSGFGLFISDHVKNRDGVKVVKIEGKSFDESVRDLADKIKIAALADRETLEEMKVSARDIVMLDNWTDLISYYFKAYELAVKKIN